MKILFINEVCGVTSTGKICAQLAEDYENQGHEVKVAYGRSANVPDRYKHFAVRIGTDMDVKIHGVQTRLFDAHGMGSVKATRIFLKWATEYNPDVLWMHNIHGYYINYKMLFDWIKTRPKMKVKWTLHDCWAFTGHCAFFTMVGCEKWKNKCSNCPQKKEYPASFLFDKSERNFKKKREAFCGVRDMTLITPSQWLADEVKKSYLKEYPVEVAYNVIDRNIFKPTLGDFKSKHGIENKKIVLGVSNAWQEPRKGLKDYIRLADMLNDEYVIVLVGLPDMLLKTLPEKIIGLTKTDSPQELAEIYSSAEVFFNPTYEDNYPTVNLEAEACGTRVITYDVGGACETIRMDTSEVIPVGSLEKMIKLL